MTEENSKKRGNTPLILVIIIAIVILGVSYFNCGFNGNCSESIDIGPDAIKEQTAIYVANNLLAPEDTLEIVSIIEDEYTYRLDMTINEYPVSSHVSKDGKFLYSQGIDMTLEIQPSEVPAIKITKSDKPIIELFVMSHCPYGLQIEKGILPVVKTLGNTMEFQLKFVDYAMHDQKELKEQMYQYCIEKEYPGQFLDYLHCFVGSSDYEVCSENMDTEKLDSCVAMVDHEFKVSEIYNNQSSWETNFPPFNVYKEENDLYGVKGSPTLIINGETVSSPRDPSSLLRTICAAYNVAPEECNTELSSTTPSAGFGFDGEGTNGEATCN